MRAVRTILSISFLLLTSSISAGDTEVSNELPDEIKNLNVEFIIHPHWVLNLGYPKEAFKNEIQGDVWIRLKLKKNGKIDEAEVFYCSAPNNGFERSALNYIKKCEFSAKKRSKKVSNEWLYTNVSFDRFTINKTRKKVLRSGVSDLDEYPLRFDCPESLTVVPEIFKKGVPSYPMRAKIAQKNGLVHLRVFVNQEGKPVGAKIDKTTDLEWKYGFNEAALSAVMSCRFKPMLCNGKPSKCSVVFPYEFVLHEKR